MKGIKGAYSIVLYELEYSYKKDTRIAARIVAKEAIQSVMPQISHTSEYMSGKRQNQHFQL